MSQSNPTPIYDASQLPVIPLSTHHRFKNLIGHPPYGRLTVIAFAGAINRSTFWYCRCSCDGRVVRVNSGNLSSGHTVSCGCLFREKVKAGLRTRHGRYYTREHNIWRKMQERCDNPNSIVYHLYGSRGVKVSDRWRVFENFFADMGQAPSPRHSLDRFPNKNGNYEAGNVRWATPKQQARNMRVNRIIEFRGEPASVAEWAERVGISASTVYARLDKLGWSVDRALTEPLRPMAPRKKKSA